MEIDFEFPRNTKNYKCNLVLSSNDRLHVQQKANITKRIRQLAHYQMKSELNKASYERYSEAKPCVVTVKVGRSDKRLFDPPNLYPTIKAIMDGFTDAGLWIDDNYNVIRSMTFLKSERVAKKGFYIFEIEVRDYEEEKYF